MRRKFICKALLFSSLIVVVVFTINCILIPKYLSLTTEWTTTVTYDEFYDIEKNTIDVVFLGSSHSASCFNPQVIFNNYGIKSYNLSCEQQNLLVSYYWLKEAMRYQKPQVVVLDCYMLFTFDESEALNTSEECTRKAIDAMKWSLNKFEAIKSICANDKSQSVESYIFPNIRYHERWKNLSESDFVKGEIENYTKLKGYAPLDDKVGAENSHIFSEIDSSENEEMVPLMELYLGKIVDLCAENNIELVLFKTPCTRWDVKEHNTVSNYAIRNNLRFIDFNEKTVFTNSGFDFINGMDDGVHANVWGAESLSLYIANILYSEYGVTGGEGYEQWLETSDNYEKIKEDAILHNCSSIDEYIGMLNKDRYTIIISFKGDTTEACTSDVIQMFHDNMILINPVISDSYVAVVENGDVTEHGDVQSIDYKGTLRDSLVDFEVISQGKQYKDCYSSIKINNTEYSKDRTGINIVVYSNERGRVIDSINYNGQIQR